MNTFQGLVQCIQKIVRPFHVFMNQPISKFA